MENITRIRVVSPVYDSFRVRQIEGMFDVPVAEKTETVFEIETPPTDDDWKIGLIVGPSGSGKSSVAKKFYEDELYKTPIWSENKSVLDAFDDAPIKDIIKILTVVGFSSPPSWIKPYRVLSNGEKFRCDLAKALTTSSSKRVVFDEFTSVVDRTVAKIASAAIAKAIKTGFVRKQFVAVSCHYDVTQWLEPDWVLDMTDGKISRRRLRRPPINLRVAKCDKSLWSVFSRHHYLSSRLSNSSQCYVATWDRKPVAFCALLPLMGKKGRKRVSRIVTLPDYQGIGIGTSFLNGLADYLTKKSIGLNITASHPTIISYCSKSPKWRIVGMRKNSSPSIQFNQIYRGSAGRVVVSFEYIG